MTNKYWFKHGRLPSHLPALTPATIEGWACIVVYLLIIAGTFAEDWKELVVPKAFIAQEALTWIFTTLVLLAIVYFKGEPLRRK